MKWFLISDEVVNKVQRTLIALIRADRLVSDDEIKELLHDFESSLNITDEVPEDFKIKDSYIAYLDDWGVPLK